jgi:hypothetical protein
MSENNIVTLFERVTWPLLFLLQKVSNSFLQNAKGYQLPPAKSQKILENKSAKRAQITFGAVTKGNLLPFGSLCMRNPRIACNADYVLQYTAQRN